MSRSLPQLAMICGAYLAIAALIELRASADDFRDHVAPILQRRCVSCHNDQQRKGDFSLETADSAFSSGFIEAGDPDASHLIEVITTVDGKAQMPKDADPLSSDDVDVLTKWIASGAKWPDEVTLGAPKIADLDWWSLRPLKRPALPRIWHERTGTKGKATSHRLELRTEIDAFIQEKLDEHKLISSVEADRRTLIRRLYFDLIGLPPTPGDVEAFVNDAEPNAYERLVDRLLASERYGERWARHWLDIVHYADTHGYDKDKPRPNAWPYRDYVIRSLNQDKPYARFVMEQIAGDALWPDTVDGITATGFIAAGPWDFIGHAEVPESKIDGKIARHLDRDDMVTSTLNTFCSVTVQCARCHNHKFDPVTQEHYYSLQAVFAALDRADRPYDLDSETASRRATLAKRKATLEGERASLDSQVAKAAGPRLAEINQQLSGLEQQSQATTKPEFGFHSQIEKKQDVLKWLQIDLGESVPISRMIYVGCHDDFNGIGAGFGFPVRYRIEVSNDSTFESGVTVVVDHSSADVANPGITPQEVKTDVEARYVRVTATRLAPRQNDFIFALAELMVFTTSGENVAIGKTVTSLDSIEAPVRWQRKNLVDGYYMGVDTTTTSAETTDELKRERELLLQRSVSEELRAQIETNKTALERTYEDISTLPSPGMVYAGTIYRGSGSFVGTGANGGKPRPIHVLHRGEILAPKAEVKPGTVPIISDAPWQFDLPETHVESDRRIALAKWLVRHDNPLTWRSIVNRVWQYHFARGIVDTPNDFGRMGKLPTHPELLDWLAIEFRDGGQSLKELHKLIVTSSVYRQSSAHHKQNSEIDSENVFLWRMNRRRLSAEEVRDAVLAVSGQLNDKMYGPGFQLFVIERPEHSPHYEYHKFDPSDPRSHRRSIYRFIVRSQPDPFMTTLDCADSSQSVAKRDETITALQALSLLNNSFMLQMSARFADRVSKRETDIDEQVRQGFRLATSREPSSRQLALLADYAREHGTDNLCRVLFNLNEFVFVD